MVVIVRLLCYHGETHHMRQVWLTRPVSSKRHYFIFVICYNENSQCDWTGTHRAVERRWQMRCNRVKPIAH